MSVDGRSLSNICENVMRVKGAKDEAVYLLLVALCLRDNGAKLSVRRHFHAAVPNNTRNELNSSVIVTRWLLL